jgi:hypothetical protein
MNWHLLAQRNVNDQLLLTGYEHSCSVKDEHFSS